MLTATATGDHTKEFLLNLEMRGGLGVEVSDMDELIMLYHKSGGGMEDVVNTIPALGILSDKNSDLRSYQTWVEAESAIAEDGELYLADEATTFTCEHLIIVLDAEKIVHGDENVGIRKGRPLFIEILTATVCSPVSVAVYIINKNFKKTERRAECGPDCRC